MTQLQLPWQTAVPVAPATSTAPAAPLASIVPVALRVSITPVAFKSPGAPTDTVSSMFPPATGRGSRTTTHKSYGFPLTSMGHYRPDKMLELQMFSTVTPVAFAIQTRPRSLWVDTTNHQTADLATMHIHLGSPTSLRPIDATTNGRGQHQFWWQHQHISLFPFLMLLLAPPRKGFVPMVSTKKLPKDLFCKVYGW